MASTQIAFGRLADRNGGVAGMLIANTVESETIAPTSSNAVTTLTAPGVGESPIARVATDTLVYVSFGTAPDATSDDGRVLLPANTVAFFVVNKDDKAAVATPSAE
jgi:hypothetical protein